MPLELEEITVEPGEHVVTFYEDDSHLAQTVGGYVARALGDGAVAVVIATPHHRDLFAAELRNAGLDPAAHAREGTLVLIDAASMLAGLLDAGQLDRAAFQQIVGSRIRQATETGRAVCAYGEMVALLWEAGNVLAAIELERAWNELSRELPFALLCAYASESVRGHEHGEALHTVCNLHTSVAGSPVIADCGVPAHAVSFAEFDAELEAPAAARHFVARVLKRSAHSTRLLDDAALVVSELATNAVIHGRSPFSVEIRAQGDAVRLSIRDNSLKMPSLREAAGLTTSGRGLRIVEMLSSKWGVDTVADGKTVWAELQP